MNGGPSLSRSVASGVAWMLALRMSLRALGLVSTVILARLLTPEDFGIVAIAMAIFALLHLVKDFGFDTVIIQMKEPKKEHYDTAWTFNLIFGLALALILVSLSGFIASLYATPGLEPLIWAVSGLFIIGGLESVGTLDFRKNMTFEKEFQLKILPKLIGIPFTLLIAYWLRSYWALTIGTIITQMSSLFVGYWMHSYRPKLELKAAGELFNFSKWLMANNFIYYVNNRSPELIIGKMLSPHAAGLFSVSTEIGMMVTTEFSAAVSRASYPGYAKVSGNLYDLKKLYLKVLSYNSFFLFPMALGFYSVADLIVPIFLGDQWLDIIPIVKTIAIGGLLMALNSNAGYVFMAIGNPRLSTILGAIRILVFIPILIYFVDRDGIIGAAWAVLWATAIMFGVTNIALINWLPIALGDLFKAFHRPLISSMVMVLVIFFTGIKEQMFMTSDYIQLFFRVLIGVVVYFLCSSVLWLISGRKEGPESKLLFFILCKLKPIIEFYKKSDG